MLTKLLPEQISKYWDIIKYGVEQSLPPIVGESADKMNNILMSLLVDKTQCWASYIKKNENLSFEGVLLTRILYDDASRTRSLLIYCLYGYSQVDNESWIDGIKMLAKYAKSRKCSQIIAYSNLDRVMEVSKSLGANEPYYFISFDVDKIIKKFN